MAAAQFTEMTIVLDCARPVAEDSLDHLHPFGTVRDSSVNSRFNGKLYELLPQRPLKILDLGCAGGGFVEECLKDGHFAVGLEGSDINSRTRRAAWGRIPENLFTCDVTAPFRVRVMGDEERIRFDVITAWELLEHISKPNLEGLFENIRRNLAAGGFFIASASSAHSFHEEHDLHLTRETKEWWVAKLSEAGLKYQPDYVRYFAAQFVRGDFELRDGFHLVCSLDATPSIPLPPANRFFDTASRLRAIIRRTGWYITCDSEEQSRIRRIVQLLRFHYNVGIGIVNGT